MKVKNLKVWYDRKEKVKRQPKDDEFVVSQERFEEINGTNFGQLVEEVEEVKKEEPKKSTPKK